MDTQGIGASIALPEKIQEAINIAEAKIAVLREDEIRLGRSKGELEKDIARLEIRRDAMEAAIPSLESSVVNLQGTVDSLSEAAEKAREELGSIESSRKVSLKEQEVAIEATKAEEVKLSGIVVQSREALEEVRIAREKLDSDIAAFNVRKERTRELLASI